jgi:hypothetical protein
MNCQGFETSVNDLARQQIMEAGVREQALVHSGECETCALRLKDELMLTSGLRALATEMNSFEAPERVEENLLTDFRSKSFSRQWFHLRSPWSYLITTAAAVILIVLGIGVMRWRFASQSDEVKTTRTATAETPSQESTPVIARATPASSPEQRKSLVTHPKRAALVHRLVTHPSNVDDRRLQTSETGSTAAKYNAEVATQFIPLGYVSPMNLQDGAQVVRVELPRSAMVSLGLPVNMDRYSERVKADVLVGVDGLARAIRFVQ